MELQAILARLQARREAEQARCGQVLAALMQDDAYATCEANAVAANLALLRAVDEAGRAACKKKAQAARKAQTASLARLGVATESLVPQPLCLRCRDTGYVEGTLCACVRQLMMQDALEQSGLDPAITFENFCLSRFAEVPEVRDASGAQPRPGTPGVPPLDVQQTLGTPLKLNMPQTPSTPPKLYASQPPAAPQMPDTPRTPDAPPSPRAHMQRVLVRAQTYAAEFPNAAQCGWLICGGVGTGKTFLAQCMANAVLGRGYTAALCTAYEVVQAFRFGQENQVRLLDNVDLLVIDDLGTEPLWRNRTAESLFAVISTRLTHGRGLIVTTNLDLPTLSEQYGERLVSRLTDARRMIAVNLFGEDQRQKKG